jgi:hypothetical protein
MTRHSTYASHCFSRLVRQLFSVLQYHASTKYRRKEQYNLKSVHRAVSGNPNPRHQLLSPSRQRHWSRHWLCRISDCEGIVKSYLVVSIYQHNYTHTKTMRGHLFSDSVISYSDFQSHILLIEASGDATISLDST